LIEQANIFNRTIHRNLFFDRIATKKNVDVYSSRPLIPTIQSTKYNRSEKFILPPINKKKLKRPAYRTSLYHSNTSISTPIDHTLLTARGKKPESITPIKDDETIMNLQRHHAPPPSPSDDQIERILSELNHTRSHSPEEIDGYIPYRLPALDQSIRRKRTSKDITSTLSNYLQTYY
jgi:hypothetical protein